MILIISSIVFVVGIVLTVRGQGEEKNLGTFLLFVSTTIGFGVLGFLIPIGQNKINIENFQLVKTNYRTIVDTKYGTKILDGAIYYNLDKSDLKVCFIEKLNSYGFEQEDLSEIKVEIKEENPIE